MKRNQKGCPNPLFEKWLTELKDQAAANDNPIQYSFGKALSSLRKCPIRLETGKDCLLLQHFGRKICEMLDRKLEEYRRTNNLPSTSRQSSIHDILGDEDEDIGGKRAKKDVPTDKVPDQAGPSNDNPVFKVPKNRPYIPKVGTGAHAILTTMYNNMQEPNYPGFMLKKDIMSQAQRHCDSPMKNNAMEHYSGWSSMTTLIAKHFVIKKSNPAKYSLTDSGIALALSLIEGRARHHHDSDDENDNDGACSSKQKPQITSKNKKKPKASSSVSSESGSAKSSISGVDFENHYSYSDNDDDNDDDDVFKQDFMTNLKTIHMKNLESKAANTDDELQAAVAISRAQTSSKKPHDNITSKNESTTESDFENELKMALALSINETKMKNDLDFDDNNDNYFADYKESQAYDVIIKENEADEDEDLKKALAISLSESKMNNDINLDVHSGKYFSNDKKLKTNSIIDKKNDAEINDDLKIALAMSMEEAKLRESYFNEDLDYKVNNQKKTQNDFVNTKRSKVYATSSSKNEDDVICLDDDNEEEGFDKVLNNESKTEIMDESYLEFCKENAESTLFVKKKNKHFIFTDGSSDCNLNAKTDEVFAQEKKVENKKMYSTPKKFDSRMNYDQNAEKLKSPAEGISIFDNKFMPLLKNVDISPENTNSIDHLKKTNGVDEIVISDDDENVEAYNDIPAKVDNIFVSSSTKSIRTPTKIDKTNQEISELNKFSKFIDLPSTSNDSNANSANPSKIGNEKASIQSQSKAKEKTAEEVPYDSFIFLPNNFDIILLVDTQETSGYKKKAADDATISELADAEVLFEVRSLKVGDFTWIARCRLTKKELIFPYIIERKRLDDLGGSITDGRYHEQKHRLRQSGIKNVIYLIEHYGKNYHGAIPLTSLLQAGINTTVQDGFITKFTKDHKDSMFYLAALTKKLIKTYRHKELRSCLKKDIDSISQTSISTERLMEFSEFNKAALKTKQFTVREMLIKQLVQLKGMSAEKAIGIAEVYPSPQCLMEAFRKGGKTLLADIEVGSSRKKIGPAISNILHMFYTRMNLN